MASAGPLPGSLAEEPKSKTGLLAAVAGVVVLLVAALFFLGGDSGGLVISVAGPNGKAVKGVTVLVDDEKVCDSSTCKVEDLEPGSYVIKAIADGYAEMAGKAYEVEPGKQKAINIELALEGAGTGIKVASKASGLTLSIDGEKIGALPQEVTNIDPGEHKVQLSGSKFIEDFEQTVTVKEGEMFELDPKLELKQGQVSIQLDDSAKGAKVALVVNGKRRSLASTIRKAKSDTVKIDLPVDGKTYKIIATRKGYEDFEEDLSFSVENPVQTVDLTLTEEADDDSEQEASSPSPAPRPRPIATAPRPSPRPTPAPAATGGGKLNINSIPVSNVILDGRPLGSTPKFGVSVSAGAHTVVFIHPQHGRKVQSVNVKPGSTATAAVRFP